MNDIPRRVYRTIQPNDISFALCNVFRLLSVRAFTDTWRDHCALLSVSERRKDRRKCTATVNVKSDDSILVGHRIRTEFHFSDCNTYTFACWQIVSSIIKCLAQLQRLAEVLSFEGGNSKCQLKYQRVVNFVTKIRPRLPIRLKGRKKELNIGNFEYSEFNWT